MTKRMKQTNAHREHDHGLRAWDGLPMDDSGNAERLVKVTRGGLRYVTQWGRFLVWMRSGVWAIDYKDARATKLAKQVAVEFRKGLGRYNKEDPEHHHSRYSAMRSGIAGMLNVARADVAIDHELLDADPELLNVANGTIDLRTGELLEHHFEDFLTQQSPVEYDADAKCPTWLECLKTWQPDPAIRRYLQVRAGACATGVATESLDIDWGTGANGKSVFHSLVMHVLGEYAVVPHKSLIVSSKHEGHPTNVAALFRKRCAVTGETKATDSLDEEHVKSMTGKDRLTARRMREDFWDFDPTHTLILHSNYRPKIRGTDEAIWRRVRLVPWSVTIPETDRDPFLPVRLEDEAVGILRWVVEGAQMFLADGIDVPEAVRIATDDYREAEDVLGQFLADTYDFTRKDSDVVTAYEITFESEQWREQQGLKYDFSPRQLSDALQRAGAWSDGVRVRTFRGVRTTEWYGLVAAVYD